MKKYYTLSILAVSLAEPAEYPSSNKTLFITGDFLEDPIVTEALALVNQQVPPELLQIQPSIFLPETPNIPSYQANPEETCYWPNNLCVRENETETIKADISQCSQASEWAVTYDDGPTDQTGRLVDALSSASLNATFFVVGAQVKEYPEVLRKTYAKGNEIGSHTWSHNPLTSMSNAQIVAEVKYTEAIIYANLGIKVTLFRPPYGDIDDRVRAILKVLGYRVVMWTTNPSRDTNDAGISLNDTAATTDMKSEIVQTVKNEWFPIDETVLPKGIISLQHDLNSFCVDLAVDIINEITASSNASSRVTTSGACNGILQERKVEGEDDSTSQKDSTSSAKRNVSSLLGLLLLAVAILLTL